VAYEFINRGKTEFPEGFAEELQHQVNMMSLLHCTGAESKWLKAIPYQRSTYIEWFSNYHYDPSEVIIKQTGGKLSISIMGLWYRTIFWEVPLMAIISELYFKLTGQKMKPGWTQKIIDKGQLLEEYECHWIDFGTRRRYSLEVQDIVCESMGSRTGFLGTSNMFLAFKYGLKPHGTYAHELPMALSALYGVRMANLMTMKHWSDYYEGDVGVALPDTFTTDIFLTDFTSYYARLFDGTRQDSGNPYTFAESKVLPHYQRLGIATDNKRIVFSDSLGVAKGTEIMAGKNFNYVALDLAYRDKCQPCGGIGTNFTNDVGVKPLNMVIKMVMADFGHGAIDVVKLSDTPGKHTGNPDAIDLVNRTLNIK
jgi:nicotinate phosphoribosyltransferase